MADWCQSTSWDCGCQLSRIRTSFNVNVKRTLLFCKLATQATKKQEPRKCQGRAVECNLGRGVVVDFGSLDLYVTVPGIVQYTAAKHALVGITKSAGEVFPLRTGS